MCRRIPKPELLWVGKGVRKLELSIFNQALNDKGRGGGELASTEVVGNRASPSVRLGQSSRAAVLTLQTPSRTGTV